MPRANAAAMLRTTSLYFVVYAGFTLGRFSMSFSGSKWAWIALLGALVALAAGSSAIIRSMWRAQ